MKFKIVMTHKDGVRTVLAEARRYNGAVHLLDEYVASMRGKLKKHALPGEQVVVGPDKLKPNEVAAEVVVSVMAETNWFIRYAIEVTPR